MVRELLSAKNIDFMERAREVAEKRDAPGRGQARRRADLPLGGAAGDPGRRPLGRLDPRRSTAARAARVLDLCLVVEQFSRACGGMGVAYAVNALGSFPILLGGTDGAEAALASRASPRATS